MSQMRSTMQHVVRATAVLVGGAALPIACLSGYVFDLPPGTGGSSTASTGQTSTSSAISNASATSSSTGMSNGGSSSVSSTGTAGSTVTSTTTSSSSGAACSTLDCSQPGCGQCVPTTPPAGWTGYYSLFDGPPAMDPNTCAGTFPNQVFAGSAGLTAPPASCPCTCGGVQGAECAVPELDINDTACGAALNCTLAQTLTAGTCTNLGLVPGGGGAYYIAGGTDCGPQSGNTCDMGTGACNVSVTAAAASVTVSADGGCAPSAPAPVLQPVSWASAGLACSGATAGVGCGTSDSCLPVPSSPFVSGLCIMQAGNVACPAVQFTQQHVFYTGADDERGCTECTCGTPTGGTCVVTFTGYNDSSAEPPDCKTQVFTVQSGACTTLSGNPTLNGFKATVTTPPSGGSCSAVDGDPMGAATPSGATTFCCTL